MSILTLDDVSKTYGDLTVLDGVSLQLAKGETIAVVGPSGSGKSTLLHLMGGLDVPSRGRVLVGDEDVSAMSEAARAGFRASRLGFVFQAHNLLPQCSALENTLLPCLANGSASRSDDERARELLERVGLGDRLDHRPGELSGGECQRVAFVRALINQPDLILADEPTGALDEATAGQLIDVLLELNREAGTALVVVTHDSSVAARMQRTLPLQAGQLVAGS